MVLTILEPQLLVVPQHNLFVLLEILLFFASFLRGAPVPEEFMFNNILTPKPNSNNITFQKKNY